MKVHSPEPQVSADKRSVTFIMIWQGEPVTCVISRAALETYFWLAPGADDARTIRVFNNGFGRIHAVAERKLRARDSKHLELSTSDFAKN
jgi:hypothetical protein